MEIMTVKDPSTNKYVKVLTDRKYLRGDMLIHSELEDNNWVLYPIVSAVDYNYTSNHLFFVTKMWRKVLIIWK